MNDQHIILQITNHHAPACGTPPRIEERPGQYLGYFESEFGEQSSHILESLAHRPGCRRNRRLSRCSPEEQAANLGRVSLLAVSTCWTKASFWDIIDLSQITFLILVAVLGKSSLYFPFGVIDEALRLLMS